MLPTQSKVLIKPNTWRKEEEDSRSQGKSFCDAPQSHAAGRWVPTTDVLRRDQRGSWIAVHLFSGALHAEISRRTCVGSVADLMSERPLAQQQLLTSHMTEKMTVMRKSCERGTVKGESRNKRQQCRCCVGCVKKKIVAFLTSLTTSGPLLFLRYLFW